MQLPLERRPIASKTARRFYYTFLIKRKRAYSCKVRFQYFKSFKLAEMQSKELAGRGQVESELGFKLCRDLVGRLRLQRLDLLGKNLQTMARTPRSG